MMKPCPPRRTVALAATMQLALLLGACGTSVPIQQTTPEKGAGSVDVSGPSGAAAASKARPSGQVPSPVVPHLTGLGLSLLANGSRASGGEHGNAIVSPVSLASALGLIHAGAKGSAAAELDALLGAGAAGHSALGVDYPALLKELSSDTPELRMLNRVWVARANATAVAPTYLDLIGARYAAGAERVDFKAPSRARATINRWASMHSAGRIDQLLAPGAVTSATRLVATSAVHFRAAWTHPFSPGASRSKPFHVENGAALAVPTMTQLMRVRAAEVNGVPVLELPFAGERFVLTIAQVPANGSLDAFTGSLSGAAWLDWTTALIPLSCTVELPRFSIQARSVSFKSTLQALGVRVAFTSAADYSAMLGGQANGIALDQLFQSAGIEVNEHGAEAVAATAAVMAPKSVIRAQDHPACRVNRPFMFVISERRTGAPIFIGKVAAPQT
jgi:serine protease inhibitor